MVTYMNYTVTQSMIFFKISKIIRMFLDIVGFFGGVIDYETEPFCGRSSGKNVARIYDKGSIDVNNGGHVSPLKMTSLLLACLDNLVEKRLLYEAVNLPSLNHKHCVVFIGVRNVLCLRLRGCSVDLECLPYNM